MVLKCANVYQSIKHWRVLFSSYSFSLSTGFVTWIGMSVEQDTQQLLKQLLLLPLLPPPLLFRIVWANLLTIRFLYHMVINFFSYSLEFKKLLKNILGEARTESFYITFKKCIVDIYKISTYFCMSNIHKKNWLYYSD